jgi:putative FmdB family regulatory protein
MPLYEYRCESCGEKEEKLEGFSAPEEHACELCGAPSGMKRLISISGFSLAGGGWHSQGYSGPAPEKKTETAAPEAPKGGCAGGCACHSAPKGN